MVRNTPLKKYIAIFAGAYLAMMIIVAVVLTLLDLEGNAGLSMGMLIGSAMAAGHYFLRDQQRLPTASEKTWLISLSYLASIVVSLVFVAVIAVLEPEGVAGMWVMVQAQSTVFLIVMVLVSLVCLLVLWMAYGFLLKRQFLAMQKKAAAESAKQR
ncbi:ABZJ_00895 family protein [Halopseudomonas pelagia]|uniref:ABZJ_00895 family protein n=1 Tax=Halopseudomonas pelagia TaxID=553151 RepID=UPI00039C5ECE|nr:ABZJ_00895 family protein [Halopseudomonas pelagia]|tara:strand:- start:11 stop:478 length:468 start_codon:yes stop_codon:yes gene_type:complete